MVEQKQNVVSNQIRVNERMGGIPSTGESLTRIGKYVVPENYGFVSLQDIARTMPKAVEGANPAPTQMVNPKGGRISW